MYDLQPDVEALLGQQARNRSVNGMFSCPFHDEDTPSFSIHLIDGLWYCFGCGKKGNLESLYRQLGTEPSEEQRHNLLIRSVFREPEARTNFAPLANRLRLALTGRDGQAAWNSFIGSRPVSADAAVHFGVGWSDEKSALAFPYWDNDGTVHAIKYRHSDGSKSSESGSKRTLYNAADADGAGTVLICEGESDTLSAWSRVSQFLAVCGSPGASVSDKTWANWGLDFLFARRIYLAFDADEAGDHGSTAAMRVLGTERCVRIRPTRGKDLSEHITNGGTLHEIGLEEANDNL